ncbi:MAG: hypothetical protein [aquatic viral metagenome]
MLKPTKIREIKLPIDNIISEVLARPDIVKMLKYNGRLIRQGRLNQLVLPRKVENVELLPEDYQELLASLGVIEGKDQDVLWVNLEKLNELRNDSEGSRKLIENIAEKYGIDVRKLLNQVESIKTIIGE